jgi:hypothetical protein
MGVHLGLKMGVHLGLAKVDILSQDGEMAQNGL